MSRKTNYVRTKELANGNKLVVIGVGCKYEYAPRYDDLKRVIVELIKLYGKDEVIANLGLSKFICKGELSLLSHNFDEIHITEGKIESQFTLKFYIREGKCKDKDKIDRSVWVKDPFTDMYFTGVYFLSETEKEILESLDKEVKNVESISQ